MRVRQAHVFSPARLAALVLLAAASVGSANAVAAAEQKKWRPSDPFTTIWNTKLHADPGHVPEFVEKSRPAGEHDFLPLTAPETERLTKRKSASELKAMESELESAGAANRRRAGQSGGEGTAQKSGKVSTVRSGAAAPIH
jgi:hypothetical protein